MNIFYASINLLWEIFLRLIQRGMRYPLSVFQIHMFLGLLLRIRNLFVRTRILPPTSKKRRKTWISTVLWLLYDFLFLQNDVNVHPKGISQKLFKFCCCWHLQGHWRKEQGIRGSGSASGSVPKLLSRIRNTDSYAGLINAEELIWTKKIYFVYWLSKEKFHKYWLKVSVLLPENLRAHLQLSV